jgi:hypothetical protein
VYWTESAVVPLKLTSGPLLPRGTTSVAGGVLGEESTSTRSSWAPFPGWFAR